MIAATRRAAWLFPVAVSLLTAFGWSHAYGQQQKKAAEPPRSKRYLTLTSVFRPDPAARGPTVFGLTRSDLYFLQDTIPAAKNAITLRTILRTARYARESNEVPLIGCSSKLAGLAGIRVVKGRFLTAAEAARAENVCVIGERLGQHLFSGADPLGRNVRIDNQYFLVVGVARSPGVELDSVKEAYAWRGGQRGRSRYRFVKPENLEVYIPLRAMKSRFGDIQIRRGGGTFEGLNLQLSEIWIPAVDAAREEQIRTIMRRRRAEKNDYRVRRRLAY